ncbi:serine/threonine protein kinase [Cuspidothrix issatschenkoi]|uniref:Serine/threonine protein kinase n=1 Tax=Cuspidothrix issatschenkoi CHARLIE-1 TaxID=2052836 RepID=A0A2S6CWT0_9CYAN|nr:serine/threonine-protein kinase [Cuspidothrix issatschenkoi]PPJ64244.1 serine/threonine protein kinase [Cuspidothrix issatschenkoi CHARLIE-1]
MVWQKGYKLQGGRYIIEKVLGEGGFGITYQAQHTLLKQWVVIKTPNESLKNDPEYPNYVKRFIQEGRKLAQLSQQPHPNIVRVTELFEDGKTYCLVMDFVPGESLFNFVHKRGALPELKAVEYIKQIGEALIFVHHQGLVHRDAHPGNIMVQKNGKAVLIDFGIAGEIMPHDGYFTSHHPANIAFAPYEQMGGNRQVTIDVYTLAASLYYAVTGKRPESSLDRKLYNKPLISPNKYVVGISDGLNRAILKGMNLEAENRPQSMREWLKLLPDVGNQVYQVSQKIEHQTIRTEKTVPVIVGVNNSPNVRVNRKNIPWFLLGAINLIYLITGVLLPANLVTLFLALFLASIPTRFYKWAIDNFMEITLERIFYYQAVIIVAVISNVYFYPKEKLEKYFSKLHTSLIMICTSYLGLFLGWLIYQIFPIFGNR